MLTLCGQTFEPVWTDFGARRHANAAVAAGCQSDGRNSGARSDGERLTQTAPILLQLAEQYGRFGGETAKEKFELLRWLFWDNHKLTGLHGDLSIQPHLHRVSGPASAAVSSPPH